MSGCRYAHAEAPTPISALLSPAMIGIGAYILIRMFTLLLPSAYVEIGLGLAVWGVITMFYGGIMALAQDDIKRLFAYSSISQMGYIIFGLATATQLGVAGSIFQFVSHGTAKSVLFMVAGLIIVQAGGLRSIKGMGGLAAKLTNHSCLRYDWISWDSGFPGDQWFPERVVDFWRRSSIGQSGRGPGQLVAAALHSRSNFNCDYGELRVVDHEASVLRAASGKALFCQGRLRLYAGADYFPRGDNRPAGGRAGFGRQSSFCDDNASIVSIEVRPMMTSWFLTSFQTSSGWCRLQEEVSACSRQPAEAKLGTLSQYW